MKHMRLAGMGLILRAALTPCGEVAMVAVDIALAGSPTGVTAERVTVAPGHSGAAARP